MTSTISLNQHQSEAASYRGTALLVVAGAGTGKTRALVARVANLLDSGANPNRILLVTFTRRSASEMVNRVYSATQNRSANQIWAGTFHSVASRLLRNYGAAAGIPEGFTVVDNGDAIDLFTAVRSEEGFGERGKRFPKPSTIAAIYSRTVNMQQPLSQILDIDFPWCREHGPALKVLFDAYTTKKRQSHILDFDDLLLFWRALAASPVGEAMRCMFDHILIDEYQDTNPIQSEIVQHMKAEDTQLCVVGDDAQSIYSFRAATVANMLDFPKTFPNSDVIFLEENYRSTAPTLDVANSILAQQPSGKGKRFEKTLWTNRTGGKKPVLITCADESEQSFVIAQRILDARERGIDLRDQAVLFRAGHHGDALELELARRDIPYKKYGGLKYLEAAHIKDVLSLLRILENPEDQPAWFRVIRLLTDVGPARAQRLLDELRVTKPNSNGLSRFVGGVGRVPGNAEGEAQELRSAFADCIKDEALTPAQQIERLHPFCGLVFPHTYENSKARLADIEQLARSARAFESRARFLAELTLDPPERSGDFAGPPHLDDDWLTLSTIHSAKGLEWKSVYIIHAADGNIPAEMALGNEEGLEEERRLLYVAITRSKEELTVSFPLRYHIHRYAKNDRHNLAQLSRFLQPIQPMFDAQSTVIPEQDNTVGLSTVGVHAEVDSILQTLWE